VHRYDLPATGDDSWRSQHEYGREKGSRPSGDIETYLLDRYTFLPTGNPFGGFYFLAGELLDFMESGNIVMCELQGID
jgi:hypothetical protein